MVLRRKCPGLKPVTEAMDSRSWMLEVRSWKVKEMIKSYKDLEVYQSAYQLAINVHQMTQNYPDYERYELGGQLRRAATSIPMNIAEGYGKKRSVKDFKRFLLMALGSCNEVQVLLDMSKDLGYIGESKHGKLTKEYEILGRRLNVMIDKWQTKPSS